MKLQLSPKLSDLLLELSVLAITVSVVVVFGLIAFVGFLYPFPTYRYFPATVEYQNEIPVAVEEGGLITDVLIQDHATVYEGQPIIRLSNAANIKESSIMNVEIAKAREQLAKTKELVSLGSVSPITVREQELAVKSLSLRRNQMADKVVRAPYGGKIYFNSAAEELRGQFAYVGQTVGYLYPTDRKILKITTSTGDFPRFQNSAPIKLFSRELDQKRKQMKGVLYRKEINREKNELLLYGTVTTGYNDFAEYSAGSQINVGILVTNTSLYESFFGYDLYASLAKKYNMKLFEPLNRFILWVQG